MIVYPWKAHQGLAHDGPGGDVSARPAGPKGAHKGLANKGASWPTQAQGGPQGPRGARKGAADKCPRGPTRAQGGPPAPIRAQGHTRAQGSTEYSTIVV